MQTHDGSLGLAHTFVDAAAEAGADAIALMDTDPVDKDSAANSLTNMREPFTKSLASSRPLKAGTALTLDMLVAKMPGTGISAGNMGSLQLGREHGPERRTCRMGRPPNRHGHPATDVA